MEWVERLARAVHAANCASPVKMKLAAHLCASRVQNLLAGDTTFLSKVVNEWSFGRVQINATAVNGVDTSCLNESVPFLCRIIEDFAHVEFILQQNEETRPLWQGLLDFYHGQTLPSNVSMLVDESKGTGAAPSKSWPCPLGYAGGIGPHNIQTILESVVAAADGKSFWIDMESSLRSIKNGNDVFDLDKCYQVMESVCDAGLMMRPNYLPQ
jgi:hypothetical protein